MGGRIRKAVRNACTSILHTSYSIRPRGFTLIETLVAVSFLSVAIVAPMSLVSQSLSTAYHARDQVAAFNLAQEGLESVRSIRDGNILQNALLNANTDLLAGIPISIPFVIDARNNEIWVTCTDQPLKTDGTLYGYGTDPCSPNEAGWTPAIFSRVLTADFVPNSTDEIRVSVTVSWRTASAQIRTFTIYENMYRWVEDGSAAQ